MKKQDFKLERKQGRKKVRRKEVKASQYERPKTYNAEPLACTHVTNKKYDSIRLTEKDEESEQEIKKARK